MGWGCVGFYRSEILFELSWSLVFAGDLSNTSSMLWADFFWRKICSRLFTGGSKEDSLVSMSAI